jgi:hypothetical protein
VYGALWWVLVSQLTACADLPSVELGECGNAIIEAGEDCDSFDKYGKGVELVCREPGKTGECHLDCTPHRDGTRSKCPDGWGCDIDNLCRVPEGTFKAMPRNAVGGIDALATGNFDNDDRTDLLSRKPQDLVRRASLGFHYFDARGNLIDSRPLPIYSTWPAIGQISGDGGDDLAFSDGRLGMLTSRPRCTRRPGTLVVQPRRTPSCTSTAASSATAASVRPSHSPRARTR